jgi:hypothetical protein
MAGFQNMGDEEGLKNSDMKITWKTQKEMGR